MDKIANGVRRGRIIFRNSLEIPLNRRESTTTEFEWRKPYGIYNGIEVFNSAARRKVSFIKRLNNFVTFFTCGPTVYDSAHLGHASSYVKLDVIQRILRDHFKFNLITVMNITDIDDKIIRRSQECGRNWKELARGYEAEFWSDMQRLNIRPPTVTLRVTENIPTIIEFIQILLEKEMAYVAQDKSVYFKSERCKYHNKLQNSGEATNTKYQSEKVQINANFKKNAKDFVLWKSSKSPDEPSWSAPWGNGRPGWHTECSALASRIFKNVVDFHAGGIDLRFPHHENEEAQCCAYHDTDQWVNYWLHTGQLNLEGDNIKMSKSLGNTVSVSGMLSNFSSNDFRMACLLSNYGSNMVYSKEMMDTARNTLNKFESFNINCEAYLTGAKRPQHLDSDALIEQLKFTATEFDARLRDDFNTAQAISILVDQISSVNRCINEENRCAQQLQTSPCLDVIAAIQNFVMTSMECFGLRLSQIQQLNMSADNAQYEGTPDVKRLLNDLITLRKGIRKRAQTENNKELFKISDELRDILREHHFDVRDHTEGSTWSTRKSN